MTRYHVVPATPEHAHALARTMRAADVAELRLVGHEPLGALLLGIQHSREPMTGLADGRPVCMFGVCPQGILSEAATIWLLGAEELPRHAHTFLRLNRRYMDAVRTDYRLLFNFVDERNVQALRWLRWLGFTITDRRHPAEELLRYFELRT